MGVRGKGSVERVSRLWNRLRRWPWPIQIAVLGIAHYLTARLGLAFGQLDGIVAPVWPPSGVAVVGLLVFGRRAWPGVLLSALTVDVLGGLPVGTAVGMAAGTTLEAVFAVTLLQRLRFRPSLDRLRDVTALTVTGVLACAAGAVLGAGSLVAGGIASGGFWETWRVWWLGDVLGVLAVGPFLLSLVSDQPRGPARPIEMALLMSVFTGAAIISFGPPEVPPYVLFPLMVWTAARSTSAGVARATLIAAVVGVIRTTGTQGVFAGADPISSLYQLDAFLAVLAVSGLALAAVVNERDRAHGALRRSHDDLEARVVERTAALRRDSDRLAVAQRIAQLGSWEWDVATDTVRWSAELYRIFGLASSEDSLVDSTIELSFASYLTRIHPDDRAEVEAVVSNALADHNPFAHDHRVVLPDGRVRWLRTIAQVVTDRDDTVVGMTGTCQDISDRKHDEERFRNLLEAALLDVSRRQQAEEALAHQALHDTLTGLPNRALLTDRLAEALSRAERHGIGVAVLFLDVDRFKLVNDSLGHAAGDEVLVAVAERLRATLRSVDTICRFGGDEFVVITERTAEAALIAERLIGALKVPFRISGEEVFLSVSVGVAVADPGETSPDALLRDADAAMYRAKEGGRARVECFDETMRTEAARRLESQNALHRALERDEFRLHYQPTIDLQTGRVESLEALVRWQHPERGEVGPADFIPLAEESGLIVPLGTWVLEEAIRQHARWRVVHPRLVLGVNISARQLRQPDLVPTIGRALATHGVDPRELSLELTESVLMEDLESYRWTLGALRDLGVRLAIDDFGTGYSSLTYLRRFPVDVVKIDRTFVQGLGQDAADTAIVESVIDLAHALGLRVVAEGVETPVQLDRLRRLGCDVAQGYLFARPQPAEAIAPLLGRRFLSADAEAIPAQTH